MTTTPDLWRNPFIDNTFTHDDQRDGVVAPTAGDQFFAVWVHEANFSGGLDTIVALKFDSLGNPLAAHESNITEAFSNDLLNPAAVRLPIAGQADGLAVAFELDDGSGLNHDIFVVRTDAGLNLLENFISI